MTNNEMQEAWKRWKRENRTSWGKFTDWNRLQFKKQREIDMLGYALTRRAAVEDVIDPEDLADLREYLDSCNEPYEYQYGNPYAEPIYRYRKPKGPLFKAGPPSNKTLSKRVGDPRSWDWLFHD